MYKTITDLEVGQNESCSHIVTHDMILQFGTLTYDSNPLHSDYAFGHKTQFNNINAQGLLLGSLIVGIIGSDLPGPGWMCLGVDLSFNLPVFPEDQIEVSVTVDKIVEALGIVVLKGQIKNARNDVVCRADIKVKQLEIKNGK